jgi:hypothetical protein
MAGKTPKNLLKGMRNERNRHLNAIGIPLNRRSGTAVPPPLSTPPTFIHGKHAPAITISGENFVERQESAGCGRHALNNLLGGVNFKKEYDPPLDINNISQLPPGPVALQTICRYLRKKLGVINPIDDCPANEYYDQSVLEAGMRLFGYTSKVGVDSNNRSIRISTQNGKGKIMHRSDKVIMDDIRSLPKGYIGFTVHLPGHWTAIKKLPDNTFKYIDSIGPKQVLLQTLEKIIEHLKGVGADVIVPYYNTNMTTDYTREYKARFNPGAELRLTDEEFNTDPNNTEYILPDDHVLVLDPHSNPTNNGKKKYVVVHKDNVDTFRARPAPPSAAAPAPAPAAPVPTPAPQPPPQKPVNIQGVLASLDNDHKYITRVNTHSNPQRWIQSNVNAIIANSPLTPVFKKNPGLEKVFRDNYEYLKPFLQEKRLKNSIISNPYGIINVLKGHGLITPKLLENQTTTREGVTSGAPVPNNNSLPTTPFFSYNGQIIKVLSRLDDGRIRYVELIEENGVNTWGEEQTRDIPDTELTPIVCPPTKQEGGRRKTMRTKAKGKGKCNGRAKVRPTRRHRKRA